ncbi:glycoside hydrolase family 5 protein [Uliginosibacterium sp. sgz301328]|uniref:glycoside hydrolase family 5 protein n=1 Tax=Uliginosibacterium sp. sgz301328 TaxID=3243764 RepID=UPI00359D7568
MQFPTPPHAIARIASMTTLSLALAACGGGGAGGGAADMSSSSASSSVASSQGGCTPDAVANEPALSSSAPSVATSASSSEPALVESPGQAEPAEQPTFLHGVNLAGGEFGSVGDAYGYRYIYPNQREVDYYLAEGMKVVRIPFRWERLQPTIGGALSDNELACIDAIVAPATAAGMRVILDPHNYARYGGQLIGSAGVPTTALPDFWRRLAEHYRDNPRVIFGLMNEPHGIAGETWAAVANDALSTIRATGANNLVLVPGTDWSNAHSWLKTGSYGTPNGTTMLAITDPANNMAFELHQYLDGDASGTRSTCSSATTGSQRVAEVTAWLRAHGKRGFLAEFAGGDNPTCRAAITDLLGFLRDNGDVWMGWSWWAGGPWWGEYMFTLEPLNGVDRPMMSVLAPYL